MSSSLTEPTARAYSGISTTNYDHIVFIRSLVGIFPQDPGVENDGSVTSSSTWSAFRDKVVIESDLLHEVDPEVKRGCADAASKVIMTSVLDNKTDIMLGCESESVLDIFDGCSLHRVQWYGKAWSY